ncbi:MAG: hypothetical protein K6347_03380 [Campylobacterales bacterium]
MRRWLMMVLSVITVWAEERAIDIVKPVSDKVELTYTIISSDDGLAKQIGELVEFDFSALSTFLPKRVSANEALLVLTATKEKGGVAIEVSYKGAKPFARGYKTDDANRYPFLVHRLAAELSEHLTKNRPIWLEKPVLYARYAGAGKSDIYVADYTFRYQRRVITGGMNIFPKWADQTGRSIYYTANEGRPILYRADLYSGERERILSSGGMTVCSDVSPDGSRLLVTMAPKGEPNIYLFERERRKLTQLTTFRGIDVSALFAPGEKIVMVSDRMGYPNIYTQKIGEERVEQVVFATKSNLQPRVYGTMLAYLSQDDGQSSIFLGDLGGHLGKRIATGGRVEWIDWSPDGKRLLALRESHVVVVDPVKGEYWALPTQLSGIQSLQW